MWCCVCGVLCASVDVVCVECCVCGVLCVSVGVVHECGVLCV